MIFSNKQKNEEISSPMDIKYMKIIKRHLHIMGGWPFNELYEAYREEPKYIPLRNYKFLVVFLTAILLNCLYYLKLYIKRLDFFKLGQIYIVLFMNVVALQRIALPFMKSYRTTVADFVLKIHLFHHTHRSNYAIKINNKVNKILKYFTTWILMELFMGTAAFHVIPLYNNIQSGIFSASDHSFENGTLYEHAIYHYMPIKENNIIYSIIFILNLMLTFDGASSFCIYDLLMSIILIHVWGHLKILKHHLENFPRPKAERSEGKTNGIMYSKEESQKIFNMLKQNIEHHKLIMEFMDSVLSAFGIMMCVYYLFHQVSGCVLLLEMSALNTEDFISYSLMTLVMFQQLIQTSVVFELIGSKSEAIKDAVYGVPWECMDDKNRKIILFFLYNVQTPISLRAMGLVTVGVQTAATIIKTSLLYFLMLRTLTNN